MHEVEDPGASHLSGEGSSGSSTATYSGRLVILSGPSGVGKDTLVRRMRERHPEIWLSISATTRQPRHATDHTPAEKDGEDYYFLTHEEFQSKSSGEWLETAPYGDDYYGTPLPPLEERLGAGKTAVLVINIEGARKVHRVLSEKLPGVDAHFVFLAPPSREELVRRLTGRYEQERDRIANPARREEFDRRIANEVQRRLERANEELAAQGTSPFEKSIIHDDTDRAVEELVAYVQRG